MPLILFHVLRVYKILTNLKQEKKMANYILVHGAWHTGELLEDTAAPIKSAGHDVYLPTIAGNTDRGIPSLLE